MCDLIMAPAACIGDKQVPGRRRPYATESNRAVIVESDKRVSGTLALFLLPVFWTLIVGLV